MDTAAQLQTIQTTQFYTDLRNQLRAILDSLSSMGCGIEGTLVTQVSSIVVKATPIGNGNVNIKCGVGDSGQALYEWNAPMGWVS